MEGLKVTVEAVASAMSEAEKTRALVLAESRRVIRLSKNVIHSIHVGQAHDAESDEMHRIMRSLIETAPAEIMLSNPVMDAMMEFSEAEILSDVVSGGRLRGFEELGVTPQSWIMGMADAVGELRRFIVTMLMNGDAGRAMGLFASMEDMTEELVLFDVPDAILPLRRKQDIARGILERTRSDLLNASISRGVSHPGSDD